MIIFLKFLEIILISSMFTKLPHGAAMEITNLGTETCDNSKERCVKKSECPLGESINLNRCSHEGKEELICCPLNKTLSNQVGSKANSYCQNLLKRCPVQEPGWTTDLEHAEGQPEKDSFAIYSLPTKVLLGEFPFMAAVGYGDGESKQWLCAGSLISEHFVLTSASCVTIKNVGEASWVKLGALDYTIDVGVGDVGVYRIDDKFIYHPKNEGETHDLALLRIGGGKPIKMNRSISPVCLHSTPTVPLKHSTSLGWGNKVDGVDTWLTKVNMFYWNMTLCLDAKENKRDLLCAVPIGNLRDICESFYGSPLVMNVGGKCIYQLVGLLTIKPHCQSVEVDRFFTRISTYINWIESIVWP